MPNDIIIHSQNLPRINATIRKAGKRALSNAALRVLRESKRRIVARDIIDTGNMLNSGYVRTPERDGYPSSVMFPGVRLPPPTDMQAIVAFAASYSRWVHDGTGRITARPFLLEAVETVHPHIKNIVRNAMRAEGL